MYTKMRPVKWMNQSKRLLTFTSVLCFLRENVGGSEKNRLIFSDIIDHADDDLFKQILSNPNHVLAPLLPVKAESHYSLRW